MTTNKWFKYLRRTESVLGPLFICGFIYTALFPSANVVRLDELAARGLIVLLLLSRMNIVASAGFDWKMRGGLAFLSIFIFCITAYSSTGMATAVIALIMCIIVLGVTFARIGIGKDKEFLLYQIALILILGQQIQLGGNRLSIKSGLILMGVLAVTMVLRYTFFRKALIDGAPSAGRS